MKDKVWYCLLYKDYCSLIPYKHRIETIINVQNKLNNRVLSQIFDQLKES